MSKMPGGVFPGESQYALQVSSGYNQGADKDSAHGVSNHMSQSTIATMPRNNLQPAEQHSKISSTPGEDMNRHSLPLPDYQNSFGHQLMKDRPPMQLSDYQQFSSASPIDVGINGTHMFNRVDMEHNPSPVSDKKFSYSTLTTKPKKQNGQYMQQLAGDDAPCYAQRVKAEFLSADVFSPRSSASDASSCDRRMVTSSSVDSLSTDKSPTKRDSLEYDVDASYQDNKGEKKLEGED